MLHMLDADCRISNESEPWMMISTIILKGNTFIFLFMIEFHHGEIVDQPELYHSGNQQTTYFLWVLHKALKHVLQHKWWHCVYVINFGEIDRSHILGDIGVDGTIMMHYTRENALDHYCRVVCANQFVN